MNPTRNAFGQPTRPASPAQRRRAAAWAPFLRPLPSPDPTWPGNEPGGFACEQPGHHAPTASLRGAR